MSDIRLEIPPWVGLALLGLHYWYILVPAGLALAGLGWFGRALPMALRYGAWAGAGLCAVPFLLLLVLFAGESVGQSRRAAEYRALHRTLTVDETVGTLPLPAGAVLAFRDAAHRELVSVALPRPTPVAGILLEGTVEPIGRLEWAGTLARDQRVGDRPCRAGVLWFTPAGLVTRCTLAEGHLLAGYALPPGTESYHDPATGAWEFQLPQDGPPLRLAALDADLPAGGTLVLAADGTPRRLYVPHETRMMIAGTSLYDHVILNGTALTAELAVPTAVAGEMLPEDSVVRLDLATGKVEATTRSLVIDP